MRLSWNGNWSIWPRKPKYFSRFHVSLCLLFSEAILLRFIWFPTRKLSMVFIAFSDQKNKTKKKKVCKWVSWYFSAIRDRRWQRQRARRWKTSTKRMLIKEQKRLTHLQIFSNFDTFCALWRLQLFKVFPKKFKFVTSRLGCFDVSRRTDIIENGSKCMGLLPFLQRRWFPVWFLGPLVASEKGSNL